MLPLLVVVAALLPLDNIGKNGITTCGIKINQQHINQI